MSRSRRLIAWLAKYKQTAPGLWAGGPHFLPFSREWGHHARGQDRMSTALSGSSSAGLFPFHTAYTAGCCWSAVGMETSLVSPYFFFFFFLPPFVLSPGVREGCLASHSSLDGHSSPHPTISSPCGLITLPRPLFYFVHPFFPSSCMPLFILNLRGHPR